ncbi:MAG: hypothetical protein EP323_05610, partial [Gammaproteobacteria bacterium]
MGFALKTTGFFLLLLLLSGAAIGATPPEDNQATQDNVPGENGELQSTDSAALPRLETALDRTIASYQAAIAEREADYGPFDQELSEMSYGLGNSLFLSLRFPEAMLAYQHAMYLDRVNQGVYSLGQEPMLRGIIATQQAMGETDATSDTYLQLLWLYSKAYGDTDPRMIPILDEASRWHMQAYSASGMRDDVFHLHMARGFSTYAINIASEHYGETDLKLVSLLQNTALANYYLEQHQKNYPGVAGWEDTEAMFDRLPNIEWIPQELYWRRNFYREGRKACKKMISILENNPTASPQDKARGYVANGDLLLLLNRPEPAIKSYQQAQVLLGQDAQSMIEELFGAPKMLPQPRPAPIPTVPKNINQSVDDNTKLSFADFAGESVDPLPLPTPKEYVMVAVDVSEKGTPDNINIVSIHA